METLRTPEPSELEPEPRSYIVHILEGGIGAREDFRGEMTEQLIYRWTLVTKPDMVMDFPFCFRLSTRPNSRMQAFLGSLKKAGLAWDGIIGKYCKFVEAEGGRGEFTFTYPALKQVYASQEEALAEAAKVFGQASRNTTRGTGGAKGEVNDKELEFAESMYGALQGNQAAFSQAMAAAFPHLSPEDITAAFLYAAAKGK